MAVCALTVDSATLQFQTVLADKMRLNAYFCKHLFKCCVGLRFGFKSTDETGGGFRNQEEMKKTRS